MSFNPPEGILDIGNATLRVGKLEVSETTGLNQGLQNIVKNDLLITEKETYLANKTWGIKLPTAWVGEFDLKTHDNKYVEFNFYNEGSTSNALGYTLNFKDTTLTLKYDNGNNLASETIPDVSTSTYKKVNVFFERGVIAVYIDGARVLYFKESDTYNSVHGHPGMASRVASTTGGSFVNIFIEADGSNSAVKDLRIVNGRLISDKTSNVSFIGSLGVGVHSPKESLDIRGNMHLTRVSNVSQIKVDSNVVAEYTGPHDRPLRKYPEVALTADAATASGHKGYKVTFSGQEGVSHFAYEVFDHGKGNLDQNLWYSGSGGFYNTSDGSAITDINDPNVAPQLDTNTDRGDWIGIELPNVIKLKYFDLYQQYNVSTHFPQSGTVYAKKTTSDSWSEIYRYDNVSRGNEPNRGTRFIVNSNVAYKYFALVGRKRNEGTSGTAGIALGEWELYGYEEGSGSLDTTLKSMYNVPATTGTQLEVYYDAKDLATMPSTVTDLSPNSNGGSVSGDPQVSNGAFVFDGVGDFIESGTLSLTGDAVHSISVWFNANQVNSYRTIVDVTNTTTNLGQLTHAAIRILDGKLNNHFYGDDITSSVDILANVWYHAVTTYQGGGSTTTTRKTYLNGVEITEFSIDGTTGGNLSLTSPTLCLGRDQVRNINEFDGRIANVRLYSKALNAGQVQELYDYQKDYFLGSKSQVTLYKGHLGVGVTEPSGQLELAGDERIQEYPPRALTGYETLVEGHGVFCAYASSAYTSGSTAARLPYNAFDKASGSTGLGDIWQSVDGLYNGGSGTNQSYTGSVRLAENLPNGHYLGLKMPYPVKITSFIMGAFFNSGYRGVGDGLIVGRNTNNPTWEVVHTLTNSFMAGVNGFNIAVNAPALLITTPSIPIDNTKYYDEYALVVTGTLGHAVVTVSEWRLFGTPGPTTLDKGSLSLTRSLDVPRISRYDVDTETPRPEKLVVDFDTTVNSSPTDISGQGNHGTFYGTNMNYSSADKAFAFNGTNDYIEADTGFSGNPTHTVSLWVKPDIVDANFRTVSYISSTSGTLARAFFYYHSTIGTVIDFNNKYVLSSTLPVVGEWMHLLYTYSSNGDTKLYMDGLLKTDITESNPSSTITLNGITKIGAGIDTGGSPIRFLDGQISNFKLYNVALEPSEVRKLYNLGRTGRSMVISDTAVGIGKVPEAQLDVRGNLNVDGVITTPQRPVFYAFDSGGTDTTNGYTGDVVFPNTRYNVGNCYNTSTGKFTASVAGFYWFQFQVLVRRISANGYYETTLKKNNVNWSVRSIGYTWVSGTDDHDTLTNAVPIYLEPGDTVIPHLRDRANTGLDVYLGGELSHFTGFLIG